MTTILLLSGYGATGKSLARHLLARTNANIILARRNFDNAKSFVDDGTSCRTRPPDAGYKRDGREDRNYCRMRKIEHTRFA